MIKLDKNKVYDLSELTSEQWNELIPILKKESERKFNYDELKYYLNAGFIFLYYNIKTGWVTTDEINLPKTNAKELFYTLENIQIDCTNEPEERINKMAGVFEKAGYRIGTINIAPEFYYLNARGKEMYCMVDVFCSNKTTITYDKFMELFGQHTAEKPKHYSKGIDTFSRMEANCTKEECLAFAKGNIDKYNWREKGQDLEDFKKIVSYANWAIKLIENGK